MFLKIIHINQFILNRDVLQQVPDVHSSEARILLKMTNCLIDLISGVPILIV